MASRWRPAFTQRVSRYSVYIRIAIHLAALLPLMWLYIAAFTGRLGADPVAEVIHFAGKGTLNLLLITLLFTPVSLLLKLPILISFRRLVGLYAFAYACAHLFSYIAFDLQFAWANVLHEIVERPYLTLGAAGFLLLLVLAVTSNQWSMRSLGARWKSLHKAIYPAVVVGWVHFFWSVKSVQLEPLIYALMVVGLLALRLPIVSGYLRSLHRSRRH